MPVERYTAAGTRGPRRRRDRPAAGVLPVHPRSARRRALRRGARGPARARRRGARRLAPAHRSRDPRLLHHRAGRGVVEPRALRRRALRAARARPTGCAGCTRRRARAASAPRSRGASCSGTYVLSAGYYDAYYPQGAGGAHAHRPRLPRRLRAGRARALHAHHAHTGIRARRQVRSVRDVPERHLHRDRQSRRRPRDVGADRATSTGSPSADSSSRRTSTSRRCFAPPTRSKRRARRRTARATPACERRDPYEMVVGLEVHVQLKTRTKAFCSLHAPPSARRPTRTPARSASRSPARCPCSTSDAVRPGGDAPRSRSAAP